MADTTKNHCERFAPGGDDCANQVNKGYCAFMNGGDECSGRVGAICADVEKGKRFAGEKMARQKIFTQMAATLAAIPE
jgi:hypothetical protein